MMLTHLRVLMPDFSINRARNKKEIGVEENKLWTTPMTLALMDTALERQIAW